MIPQGGERRAAHPGSGYETPAPRRAGDLLDPILSGCLSPGGTARAHAGRGLACAVLAPRETVTDVAGLRADGAGGLDAVPGVIAGSAALHRAEAGS